MLVVFVGAGASKLRGSADWHGFAKQVAEALERAADTCPDVSGTVSARPGLLEDAGAYLGAYSRN